MLALAWTVAVWTVQVVLRVAVLARPDGLGNPFVGKFHWYFFHAICFDARWTALFMAPVLAHAWFWRSRAPRWAAAGLWAGVAFQSAVLLLTVSDHELQRFMGARITPSFAFTYDNAASLREVWRFLMDDRGVLGLSFVLFAACVPAAFCSWRFLAPLVAKHPAKWMAGIALFIALGEIYTEVVWPGGFRDRKLSPIPKLWIAAWREESDELLADDQFRAFSRQWSRTWLAEAGSDTSWTFPDSASPFWRVPKGVDSSAPSGARRNVVLVVIETGRALNCGFLRPYGAERDATPFLDSVASVGRVWARHSVASLPTVRSLMSIHLGVPDHPSRTIATSYLGLRQRSLANILRDRGWRTRFFSAADPAWDNETPWLEKWYDAYDYSSSRERDGDMFDHASRWMRDSLGRSPFLMVLMTKSNHYPFDQIPSWRSESDLQKRHVRSLRYTDSCLGVFVKSLRRQAWFSNTVFVVTGDHGFPLGEHGPGNIGTGLYDESIWVPLVAWGPGLTPGTSLFPSSHLDIAPTVLHLSGVRAANHFAGHDLLSDSPAARRVVWTTHGEELTVFDGHWRAHGALGRVPRGDGNQLFRLDSDPREVSDSAAGRQAILDALLEEGRWRTRLEVDVLRRNALCPQGRAKVSSPPE